MQIQCPYCGNACEVDGELTNGQHLVCPFCSEKFLYSDGEQGAEPDQHGSSLGENNNNTIAIKCPYCGARYEVDKSYEGVSCQCGMCNKDFVASAVQPVVAEGSVSTRTEEEKVSPAESDADETEKQDDRAKGKNEKNAVAIKTKACVGVLFLKAKAVAVATKDKTVKTWKNSEGTRRKIASKAKATAIMAKSKAVYLWNSGKIGKSIIVGVFAAFVLCCMLPLCTNSNGPQNGEERVFNLPGDVKMEMIYIAPGTFTMGSPIDEAGRNNDETQHQVTLTKGYWMGKYPVTQAQWSALSLELGLESIIPWFSSLGDSRRHVRGLDTSDFPMDNVSWNDCASLVKALNRRSNGNCVWSIPTEAQWEFAAKGGMKSRGYIYSGGDDLDAIGWYYENSGTKRLDEENWDINESLSNHCRTHSVHEKNIGNELGLVGMSGNVSEWCNDWYGRYPSGAVTDPVGLVSGARRVMRGGSWNLLAQFCRSAGRGKGAPDDRNLLYGFRLCCFAEPCEQEVARFVRSDKTTPNAMSIAEQGVDSPRKMVAKDNAETQFELGRRYAKGEGVEKNWHKAIQYFRKAAEQGHPQAQHELGSCYWSGLFVTQDKVEAAKWFRKAAEQGYANAQFDFGGCYFNGDGVQQNKTEATKWFRKAAERGHIQAQYILGQCYNEGVGVLQDKADAAKWFRKAAEQGYAEAQYDLGCAYSEGIGVQQSQTEAVKWYRKAAEQGYANAQNNLGNLYKSGQGVAQDCGEAVKWFRKAAEQGIDTAQCNLGLCYSTGEGVPQDLAEAARWFRKAAEQGWAQAQFNLGLCYYMGVGVQQNKTEAVRWLRKAAEQGHSKAQEFLGQCQ